MAKKTEFHLAMDSSGRPLFLTGGSASVRIKWNDPEKGQGTVGVKREDDNPRGFAMDARSSGNPAADLRVTWNALYDARNGEGVRAHRDQTQGFRTNTTLATAHTGLSLYGARASLPIVACPRCPCASSS